MRFTRESWRTRYIRCCIKDNGVGRHLKPSKGLIIFTYIKSTLPNNVHLHMYYDNSVTAGSNTMGIYTLHPWIVCKIVVHARSMETSVTPEPKPCRLFRQLPGIRQCAQTVESKNFLIYRARDKTKSSLMHGHCSTPFTAVAPLTLMCHKEFWL